MMNNAAIHYVMKNIDIDENDCWNWRGPFYNDSGYGLYAHGRVHRLTYRALIGPIPEGKFVCHSCDNRRCCNPLHLFIGTTQENTEDCRSKGRQARGERMGSAKLTSDQVLLIREDKRTHRAIAKDYSLDQSTIQNIKSRKIWAWL